jgi:hypothetical protein
MAIPGAAAAFQRGESVMTEVLHNPVTGEIIESKPNLSQPIHPSPMPDLAPAPVRRRRKKSNGKAHRPPPPADETKRAKFERLAEQRFGNVVKALHVLRKLGRNQSDYEYDDEDVDLIREKIFAEVDAACGELKRRGKPVQTKLFG